MCESLVFLGNKLADELCTLVADNIPAQIQMSDHLTTVQKVTEQLDMAVIQELVLDLYHVWLVDAPGLQCRLKAAANLRFGLEAHLDLCRIHARLVERLR